MFFCQRNSYAKELETRVVSCVASTRRLPNKQDVHGFEVVFEDTVFFAEGGGQNTDRGEVEGRSVLEVTRKGSTALHFLDGPLEVGASVHQSLDWQRRFDNMQQHTGQHLVSAILERQHSTPTLSWWMAESSPSKVGVSYIEVDKPVSVEVFQATESSCNAAVRDALPVTVNVYQKGDPELDQAHTRGLPLDHTGPVRLIRIDGLDENLCCGTHVGNLAQLQAVKLLYTESKKGRHYVYFLVGSRVLQYIGQAAERERAFTRLLRNGPEDHLDLVDKIQRSLKVAQKTTSGLFKELAVLEAQRLKNVSPQPAFGLFYRPDGDADYTAALVRELEEGGPHLRVILTGEERTAPGQLVVLGHHQQDALVAAVGKELCSLLDGKGGGKGSRFNAKINSFKKIDQVEGLLQVLVGKCEIKNC